MKITNLLAISLVLLCFSSCKNKLELKPIEKTDPLEFVKDSVSFMFDGKTYSDARFFSGYKGSNLLANIKVDSIVKTIYYYSSAKDSVMYTHTYGFDVEGPRIDITFLKKFNFNEMVKVTNWLPKDFNGFYKLGKRHYALDFGRDNSENGVAISINNGIIYKTFGSESFQKPPLLEQNSQVLSNFEIITFKKLGNDDYILEAKFNAKVFDENKNSKDIQNGFLRLRLNLKNQKY
ncbi:hypothetical protein EZJ43_01835 [Pedobacter changchengzhani]|uniref:Uncharacterized protein n=1 Tax=Pedobacter changchengzhani TaxID=2529274 RepID=A0A4R5MQC6_9SPHI|nr:hypothetical protein [Pedobacter changchengzhani]TDG37856.1 hypothetical protein EZJ43_01835 [Pedobacter changchengzhani]